MLRKPRKTSARRQANTSHKSTGHRCPRRLQGQGHAIELLEERALLTADFADFAKAMDNTLIALQTTFNNQVMSIDMPIVGTGLTSPPGDSQLLLQLQQKKFDPNFAANPATEQGVENALTAAGASVTADDSNPNSSVLTVGLPQQSVTLMENFDLHTGLLLDVANLQDDQQNSIHPVQVQLQLNGGPASQLVFTVTNNDVRLDTASSVSMHVQATLPKLAQVHGELQTVVNNKVVPLLPVLVTDGSIAKEKGGFKNDYNATDFHGDFNLSFNLNGGDVSALSQSLLTTLESQDTVNFANGNAEISVAVAVDPTKFANVEDTFPSIGTDIDINWPFPDGQVTNSKLPGDGVGLGGTVQSLNFKELQITDLTTFVDNLIGPVLDQVNQKVIPPMEAVLGLLNNPIPIINKSLLDILGVSWNQNTVDLLKAVISDIQNWRNIITNIGGDLVIGSFTLDNIDLRSVAFNATDVTQLKPNGQIDANAAQLEKNIEVLPGTWAFPLFENPATALGLFTREPVTLVQYVSPKLSVSGNLTFPDIPLPFLPSFLKLGLRLNDLTIQGQIALGYDTAGFLPTGLDPNIPLNPDPLNGFYLYSNPNDPNLKQRVTTGIQLSGSATLDLKYDQGLYQVGIGGTIGTGGQPAELPLWTDHTHVDPNTKMTVFDYGSIMIDNQSIDVVRYENLKYLASQGNGLSSPVFKPHGQLGLSLNGFIQIGIPPFAFSVSEDFGFLPIFDLTNLGQPQDVKLASFDPNTGTLVLNWAQFASNRNIPNQNNNPQSSEDFQVAPVPDPNNPNQNLPGEVAVTAFGYSQVFGAPDPNHPSPGVTTIVGIGEDASDKNISSESVDILPGVTANAVLVAGSGNSDLKAELRYSGSGNAWLFGGTAQQNLLYGGDGQNVIIGGNNGPFGGGDPTNTQLAMPNVLVGGTGKQSHNIIVAQQGGATLTAGPNDGDILIGGSGRGTPNVNYVPSVFTLIAGKGKDQLVGGPGDNIFQWQEGDGDATVYGGNPLTPSSISNNALDVQGSQGNEVWTVDRTAPPQLMLPANLPAPPYTQNVPPEPPIVSPTTNEQGVQIQGTIPGQSLPSTITTVNLDDLSIDTSSADGGNTYTVNDVTGTGLHHINVSLHEAAAQGGSPMLDAKANTITVNGSQQFANTVNVDSDLFLQGTTQVFVQPNPKLGAGGGGGKPGDYYRVTTAIPQSGDTLNVNTFGGDDQVNVSGTQGLGSTHISTGDGNDLISVGGPANLDAIFGPLYIDAGSGDFNRVAFSESGSTVGDTLALTDSKVVRVNPQPLPPHEIETYYGARTLNERYPMNITYQATNGHFESGGPWGGGVELDTTQSADTVSVPSDLANAPTTVNTSGGAGDRVFVGFDHFPGNGALESQSTLDNLASPLTVQGSFGSDTSLDIADKASAQAESYTVEDGEVIRTSAPSTIVYYSNLGSLTLNAAQAQNNTIYVDGTSKGTTTTVNAGDGNNTLTVYHDTLNGHVLDNVQSALTLNGGAGTDSLTMSDAGNSSGQSYSLGAGFLNRTAVPLSPINFTKMSSVDFHAPAGSMLSNTIGVAGTPSGVPVKIETGGSTNQINVVDPNLNTIDGLQGPLTITETATAQNTLNISDVGVINGPPVSETYGVAIGAMGGTFSRTGIANINFAPLVSFSLTVRDNSKNTVNVTSTTSGTPVTVDGGTVTNDIVVGDPQAGTLDSIGGMLTIHGAAAATSTAVSLEDQKAAVKRTYLLDAGDFKVSANPIGPINFDHLTSLTLDSGNQGNTTDVNGTATGNHVTVNAGTGDLVTIGNATNSLNPILGRVDVVGGGNADKLVIDDTKGIPMAPYKVLAGEVDALKATVGYQGLSNVLLAGSNSGDTYHINGTPNSKFQIGAAGSGNVLDTSSLTNVTVTLANASGSGHGYDGLVSPQNIGFSGIENISSAPGDGSKVDGSNFNGDFSKTLTVSGFGSLALNVPGTVSGSLLASTEGSAAAPIGPILVGSVSPSGVVKVGFLTTFTTTGDMAGTLKGFGKDPGADTIQTINVGGNLPASGEIISAGQLGTVTVAGNLAGTVDENTPPGIDMQQLTVGGSLTGTVNAGAIAEIVITKDLSGNVVVSGPIGTMSVGGNFSGNVTAASIGAVTIDGSDIGKISADQITSIGVMHASAPLPLDITQNGVERKVLVTLANTLGNSAGPDATFSYYYDGSGSVPAAHVRVNPQPLPPGDPPNTFDISLLVNGNGKFDLARLDSVGPDGQPAAAHVRNVAVEGDVLATDSPAALQFFNLPANTPGGVQLPMDDLGSIAATDNMAPGAVVVHSLQGLAFGSVTKPDGTMVPAPDAQENDTAIIAILIAPAPPVESTLLVPVSTRGPVALFLADRGGSKLFEANDVLFANQANTLPLGLPPELNPILNGIVQVQPSTALGSPSQAPSVIQTVAFVGDGASLTSTQPIEKGVTSTGPLGDLVLQAPQGLTANVTAPSILGSILVAHGSIAGTIQTTGLRTDPVTGATTQVPATLGRLITDSAGNVTGTTQIMAGEGITGRIISRGDLISRVVAHDGVNGLIAAQGNLGALLVGAQGLPVVAADGSLTRFGGVVSDGGFRGTVLALGNAYGDIHIAGGLAGQIAVQGQPVMGLDPSRLGILGNVDIRGPIRHNAKLISGGEIGDAPNGTTLSTAAVEGTVAALGDINLAPGVQKHTDDARFFGGNLTGANAAAIEAIFGKSFDLNPAALDLQDLDQMLANLAALHLTGGGGPSTPPADYVAAVYNDLLGRGPDPGGSTYWTGRVSDGTPRAAIATDLTHSDEYFATIIRPAYDQYLGRDPDTAGLQFWTDQMRAGLTDEHLEAGFIGSQEFYNHSGGTNKAWVDAMYLNLLGRAADPQGESYWTDQLNHGANRANVAFGFAASVEREQQHVSNDYLDFLGRLPDQSGLNYWVDRFALGTTNEDLISGFIASDEYYQGNTDSP